MPPPKSAIELVSDPSAPEWMKRDVLANYPELAQQAKFQPKPEEPATPPDALTAAALGAAQGATSGLSDEAGGLGAKLFDMLHGGGAPRSAQRGSMTDTNGPSSYEVERAAQDAQVRAAQAAHPMAFFSGAIPGAAAQGIAVGAAGKALANVSPALRAIGQAYNALGPITRGAIAGGAGAAAMGAGTSDPGHRLAGAAEAAPGGIVLGGAIPAAAMAIRPLLANTLGKAADLQRVKAYEHEAQAAKAAGLSKTIKTAERQGVTPKNADEAIKAAAKDLEAVEKEASSAGVRVDTKRAVERLRQELDRLPDNNVNKSSRRQLTRIIEDLGGEVEKPGSTMLPPPSTAAEVSGLESNLPKIARAPIELRTGVGAPEKVTLDMRPGAKVNPEINAQWADSEAQYPASPRPKTARPGKPRTIETAPTEPSMPSVPADERMTFSEALQNKRGFDEKTNFTASGQKRASANKYTKLAGALLREAMHESLAEHPELADRFETANEAIATANRVKEAGNAPGKPISNIKHVAGLGGIAAAAAHQPVIAAPLLAIEGAGALGLPINAAAANALRLGQRTLETSAGNLQPGLSYSAGLMEPQLIRQRGNGL